MIPPRIGCQIVDPYFAWGLLWSSELAMRAMAVLKRATGHGSCMDLDTHTHSPRLNRDACLTRLNPAQDPTAGPTCESGRAPRVGEQRHVDQGKRMEEIWEQ